jgi:hypothetical protein
MGSRIRHDDLGVFVGLPEGAFLFCIVMVLDIVENPAIE